jgi:hypothetical protein
LKLRGLKVTWGNPKMTRNPAELYDFVDTDEGSFPSQHGRTATIRCPDREESWKPRALHRMEAHRRSEARSPQAMRFSTNATTPRASSHRRGYRSVTTNGNLQRMGAKRSQEKTNDVDGAARVHEERQSTSRASCIGLDEGMDPRTGESTSLS